MHRTRWEFRRTDIWREGRYLDLWSVPHFLSGVLVGCVLLWMRFDARSAFLIALLLLIGYEMFEVIAKIKETPMNRILDVAVGMGSFELAFVLVPDMPAGDASVLFAAIGLADASLSYAGWQASRKAAFFEAQIKRRIAARRARLAQRRGALRKRLLAQVREVIPRGHGRSRAHRL